MTIQKGKMGFSVVFAIVISSIATDKLKCLQLNAKPTYRYRIAARQKRLDEFPSFQQLPDLAREGVIRNLKFDTPAQIRATLLLRRVNKEWYRVINTMLERKRTQVAQDLVGHQKILAQNIVEQLDRGEVPRYGIGRSSYSSIDQISGEHMHLLRQANDAWNDLIVRISDSMAGMEQFWTHHLKVFPFTPAYRQPKAAAHMLEGADFLYKRMKKGKPIGDLTNGRWAPGFIYKLRDYFAAGNHGEDAQTFYELSFVQQKKSQFPVASPAFFKVLDKNYKEVFKLFFPWAAASRLEGGARDEYFNWWQEFKYTLDRTLFVNDLDDLCNPHMSYWPVTFKKGIRVDCRDKVRRAVAFGKARLDSHAPGSDILVKEDDGTYRYLQGHYRHTGLPDEWFY